MSRNTRCFNSLTSFRYGATRAPINACAALMLLCSAAHAETLELVALGDSLTQGYGLPQGEGFVPTLQAWLDAEGYDVEVVNAGVSGDTTAGGLSRVEWSLSDETDAMIVALGGNDLLRGIAPETARANLDGILEVAQGRDLPVLLVGMIAPSNYGPDYKAAFDALYVELSEEYDTLFYPEFFAGLRESEGDQPQDMARFMQPDGIHPSAEGVTRIVEDMGPSVAELLEQGGADS
ncbi:Esterase TesA precursor [Roseivivax sp. THAF40]|uniref:arylesterase n=1 Tax=unclassified Roseivivax TaxID=2639302 RepID=UPI001268FBA1|nr:MULTISPECIES: arylesterase [unclassified Roseivivax]QFS82092.1 Esterase TesA precursor [Roseivivax sp. THAF197b]QFT45892.1 Esterase TesA precursor [Roseivivax sp. THAF40]